MLERLSTLPLFRPPEGLSPRDARLHIFRVALPLLAMMMHVFQGFLFISLGLPFLSLASWIAVAVFGAAIYLVKDGRGRDGMLLAYVEVAIHPVALTFIMGSDANYLMYYSALVAAPLLVFSPDERLERIVTMGYAIAAAPILMRIFDNAEPLMAVAPGSLTLFGVMNVVGSFAAVAAIVYYFAFISDRASAVIESERQRAQDLLHNILPAPIATRLQSGERVIVDSFEHASVLFADLVGFTELAARIDSTQLIDILNTIFSAFDALAEKHGLEKIKTIGDAYMIVGGVPSPRPDHADAIARMALDMQATMRRLKGQFPEDLDLRIGIASGPVVAGVIGQQKFAYDLWGDTVNTASRMETYGAPHRIQTTAMFRKACGEAFVFEERGQIRVKGKGQMLTWFLVGER